LAWCEARGSSIDRGIDSGDGGLTIRRVFQVALDEGQATGAVRVPPGDGFEVGAVSRGKIVEADDLLAEVEEVFEQMRPDEAGSAGDEPAARFGREVGIEGIVGGGHGIVVAGEVAEVRTERGVSTRGSGRSIEKLATSSEFRRRIPGRAGGVTFSVEDALTAGRRGISGKESSRAPS
jgi:hypothetical protein